MFLPTRLVIAATKTGSSLERVKSDSLSKGKICSSSRESLLHNTQVLDRSGQKNELIEWEWVK